ncbi:hypothetical protein [Blastococcus saxobsidens]|uniref:Uncharacterized protein n=1 Tax=Blastococcus saxobsidens TaxID=138336 RepID=A0A4Q7Y196_9ACTN|nr:hypothetical protein [Blastococcus saxobsidens]RZU30547.1 hypothetical protein BKA19_0166 [Blastococcus saxobsidens]
MVVRAFVDRRAQAPDGGEPIQALRPRGAFRSLHVGRPRGATLWDPDFDTCWLVAYGEYHADGDRKDVYNYFAGLQDDGLLTPTADDYEKLQTITPEELIRSLRRMAPELLQKARAVNGQEIRQDFVAAHDAVGTATITVDLVFETDGSLEEGWVGITMPPNITWPPGGALALVAALMPPEVASEDIQFSETVGRRPTAPGELAFSWSLDTTLK